MRILERMLIPRHLKETLKKRYELARSIYLYGPRQSGKTTLARDTFPNLLYQSLEDPDVLDFAKNDPKGFLNQFKTGGIIDEPQKFPELFSYLQSQIDIEKKQFILTSSQNYLLLESISQSLAGRISLLNLYPLTHAETVQKNQTLFFQTNPIKGPAITDLYNTIFLGGYPEVVETPEKREFWFNDYIKTFVERDVRQLIAIKDLGKFQLFLKLCAGRSGHVLNRATLSNEADISETTCKRWLTILEQSGVIFVLQAYHNNFNKRITKSPKLFFVDTGLLCQLMGITAPSQLATHPLRGAIVETYVISDIRKQFANLGQDPPLSFWQDHHGNEVDLIIENDDGPLPVEIKTSQTISSSLIANLEKFQKLANSANGILLYGGKMPQTRSHITAYPIGSL